MKILIVVDMQNDFIDGALGTDEAVKIVPAVKNKIEEYRSRKDKIIFTRDTHEENYLSTREGKILPVTHCITNPKGWEITDELDTSDSVILDKPTFGSVQLGEMLKATDNIEEIELIGLCTDICVISNAMIIKAFLPEIPVKIDSSCCAGVTPEGHENALSAMKMCQIEII